MNYKNLIAALILVITFSDLRGQNNENSNKFQTTDSMPALQVKMEIQADQTRPVLLLKVINGTGKRLHILLEHHFLGIVADSMVSESEFTVKYVFNEAADGNYAFILSNGKEKIRKEFSLNTVLARKLEID